MAARRSCDLPRTLLTSMQRSPYLMTVSSLPAPEFHSLKGPSPTRRMRRLLPACATSRPRVFLFTMVAPNSKRRLTLNVSFWLFLIAPMMASQLPMAPLTATMLSPTLILRSLFDWLNVLTGPGLTLLTESMLPTCKTSMPRSWPLLSRATSQSRVLTPQGGFLSRASVAGAEVLLRSSRLRGSRSAAHDAKSRYPGGCLAPHPGPPPPDHGSW
mmetsp:Transcript_18876/g.56589  ORF Transcript_18876/g.56589 Transcript_18876/m.56589 type:complete len:214 (-) Transcript_18876:492-1133(-)